VRSEHVEVEQMKSTWIFLSSSCSLTGLAICFFCPDSKGAQDEKVRTASQRIFWSHRDRVVMGRPCQAHAGDLCAILRKANQEVPKDPTHRHGKWHAIVLNNGRTVTEERRISKRPWVSYLINNLLYAISY
jgi:hypothetical protein